MADEQQPTDDTEAREIARGLTKAQREALIASRRFFSNRVCQAWGRARTNLRAAGVMHNNSDLLTPLGERVRAILMEPADAR